MSSQTPNSEIIQNGITYNSERCTALLHVPDTFVSFQSIESLVAEHNLTKKNEFHVTLIGFAIGRQVKRVLDKFEANQRKEAEQVFLQLMYSYEWMFELKSEFYLVEKEFQFHKSPKERRRSIVQLLELNAISDFYKALNEALNLNLECPFPHITLATWCDNPDNALMGIGIASKSDFDSLQPTLLNI